MHHPRAYDMLPVFLKKKVFAIIVFMKEILIAHSGDLHLFQVCVSLAEPSTRKHEIDAMIEAALELDLKQGTIVTIDQEEIYFQSEIQISIQPFWKWALSDETIT